MTAEHIAGEHNVSSFASAQRRQKGLYDPFQDEPVDAIAHFLVEAGHFKTSDTAAQYIRRVLDLFGEARPTEQAMRDRLQELVTSSKYRDDSWQDEDDIAQIIHGELRRTYDQSDDYINQRYAWRGLLDLRGVDVKETTEDDPNFERWKRLLHKLGEKALE